MLSHAAGQSTQLTIPGVVNRTYTFSATDNDGRHTQMTDAISGETVDHQPEASELGRHHRPAVGPQFFL